MSRIKELTYWMTYLPRSEWPVSLWSFLAWTCSDFHVYFLNRANLSRRKGK